MRRKHLRLRLWSRRDGIFRFPFNLGRLLPTSLHGSTNNSNFEITSAKQPLLVMIKLAFDAFGILLTASWWGPVGLNTMDPKSNILEIASRVGGGKKLNRSAGCNQPRTRIRRLSWSILTQGLILVLLPLPISLIMHFFAPIYKFIPLDPEFSVVAQHTDSPTVTEFRVLKKLTALNCAKASWPGGIPGWLLKENPDLLAPVVTEILNFSYSEARLLHTWIHANVALFLNRPLIRPCETFTPPSGTCW